MICEIDYIMICHIMPCQAMMLWHDLMRHNMMRQDDNKIINRYWLYDITISTWLLSKTQRLRFLIYLILKCQWAIYWYLKRVSSPITERRDRLWRVRGRWGDGKQGNIKTCDLSISPHCLLTFFRHNQRNTTNHNQVSMLCIIWMHFNTFPSFLIQFR